MMNDNAIELAALYIIGVRLSLYTLGSIGRRQFWGIGVIE